MNTKCGRLSFSFFFLGTFAIFFPLKSKHISVKFLHVLILIPMCTLTCSLCPHPYFSFFFFVGFSVYFPRQLCPLQFSPTPSVPLMQMFLLVTKPQGEFATPPGKKHSEDVHTGKLVPSSAPFQPHLWSGLLFLLSFNLSFAFFCSSSFVLSFLRRLTVSSSDINRQCNIKSRLETKMSFHATIEPSVHS